jgi:hypothetical protein
MHDLNLDDRGFLGLRLFIGLAVVFSFAGFDSTAFCSVQEQGRNADALLASVTVLLSRWPVTEFVRGLLGRLLIVSLSLGGTDNL